MQPKSVFVTLNSKEAYNAILEAEDPLVIKGEKVKFERAPEPSDIIWQNRCFDDKERMKRAMMAFVFAFVIVVFVFYFLMFLTRKDVEVKLL